MKGRVAYTGGEIIGERRNVRSMLVGIGSALKRTAARALVRSGGGEQLLMDLGDSQDW